MYLNLERFVLCSAKRYPVWILFLTTSVIAQRASDQAKEKWTISSGLQYATYSLINVHEQFPGAMVSEAVQQDPYIPVLVDPANRPLEHNGRPIYPLEPHFPVPQAARIPFTLAGGFFGFNLPALVTCNSVCFTIVNSTNIVLHSATEQTFENTSDRGYGIYSNGYRFYYKFRIRPEHSVSNAMLFGLRTDRYEWSIGPVAEYITFRAKLNGQHYPYTDRINASGSRIPEAIPILIDRDVRFSVLLLTGQVTFNYFLHTEKNNHISVKYRYGVIDRRDSRLGFDSHSLFSIAYNHECNWELCN